MQIAVAAIVLNGQPFLDAWLEQALYITKSKKHIHITEGACATTDQFGYGTRAGLFCDTDGHSVDGTLDWIKSSELQYYLNNGLWDSKLSMFRAHKYDDIDFVWEIDIDEFYHKKDIDKIIETLKSLNGNLAAMSVSGHQFWGDYTTAIKAPRGEWGDFTGNRIFSWSKSAKWKSHRPVKVDNEGTINFNADKLGIKLFHYSYCTKSQIEFKADYYKTTHPQKRKCFEALLKGKNEYNKSIKFLSPNAKLVTIPTAQHPIWTKDKIDGWA